MTPALPPSLLPPSDPPLPPAPQESSFPHPPSSEEWPLDLIPHPHPSPPFVFITSLGDELVLPSPSAFLPQEDGEVPGFSRFSLTLHLPERKQHDELRQYKSLCDRLLPGTRYGSHLYTLVHLDLTTFSVTLAEYGEVIGGATIRFIQVARDEAW